MARAIRASVLGDKREIYRIRYSNHEFVVAIRNRRAEILQSFQAFYGVGHGIAIAKSLADGELEICLATMAAGGEVAAHAQEIAFGKTLSADMPSQVFAYKKASLFAEDLIAERLRCHMYASLQYYKELAARTA
jgi:hypothetical protein